MKRDIPLTREQRELVENNLSLVYWVIMESIHVNETIYGFGYEDLYQEGCICCAMRRPPMTQRVPSSPLMPKGLCVTACSPTAGRCVSGSAGLPI